MRFRVSVVVFLAALLFVATPGFAQSFNFCQFGCVPFPGGEKDLGAGTIAFTAGAYELDVTAWTANNQQADVDAKDEGGTENGLGIYGTTDGEINNPGQFLQLDVTKLEAAGIGGLSLAFNSTTDGENWGVTYSNTSGTLGTLNATGSPGSSQSPTTLFVSFTSGGTTYSYLDISSTVPLNPNTGNGGNVLLASAVVTPEPTSLLLLGSGLVSMGGMLRRKKK